ncbi:MAG: AraC family transcriptional regulator [Clostridiales bacterium]|nr:AraC family transcriptional regulator [Clostridiales bacterium]
MFNDEFKSGYRGGVQFAVYTITRSSENQIIIYDSKIKRFDDKLNIRLFNRDLFNAHNHSEFEVLCVKSGRMVVLVDNIAYSLTSGDVLIINPFQIHSGFIPEECGVCEYDCIDFGSEYYLYDNNLQFDNYYKNECVAEISQRIMTAVEAYKSAYDGWEFEVRGQLCLIFSLLMKCGRSKRIFNPDKLKYNLTANNIITYINEHLNEGLTTGRVAANFSYSEAYFCHLFRQMFGCTFKEYLRICRISCARVLIENGSENVAEISNAVGISNCSYFAKIFKKQTGFLPTEYMRLIK